MSCANPQALDYKATKDDINNITLAKLVEVITRNIPIYLVGSKFPNVCWFLECVYKDRHKYIYVNTYTQLEFQVCRLNLYNKLRPESRGQCIGRITARVADYPSTEDFVI